MDELDNEPAPAEVLSYWRAYAMLLDVAKPLPVRQTFGVTVPAASAIRLQHYWETGKGGRVTARWGTEGSMQRCIRANRDHMRDPGGYCAKRHKAVTGQWPTEGGKAGIPS
jgi:hypothetical protein